MVSETRSMKLLFVIKRYSGTIGKDAILQDFGREVRLATALAKKHKVTILAGDHVTKEWKDTSLHDAAVRIRPFSMTNFFSFVREVSAAAREHDTVIGTSHPLFALAAWLGRAGKPFVYDQRDNYETYDFSSLPLLRNKGMGKALMRLVNNYLARRAALVVCVSRALNEKTGKPSKSIVVENGFEPRFRQLDRRKSRKALKLPIHAPIITYVGHISHERGADVLLKGFAQVKAQEKDAVLLLSGPVEKSMDIHRPGVTFRALPKRDDVVKGISAANIAVLPQPENETAKYTFPYKLMEYLACNTPVVATALGDVRQVLASRPESMAKPGDADDLAEKILSLLRKKKGNYRGLALAYTWETLAAKLGRALEALR